MSRNIELAQESLSRATQNQSLTNYPAIIRGFIEKGIPPDDIKPRENVFTYHAWIALGRQVRRGEHGVRVVTFASTPEKKDPKTGEVVRRAGRRPWSATVFHLSQTDPIGQSTPISVDPLEGVL